MESFAASGAHRLRLKQGPGVNRLLGPRVKKLPYHLCFLSFAAIYSIKTAPLRQNRAGKRQKRVRFNKKKKQLLAILAHRGKQSWRLAAFYLPLVALILPERFLVDAADVWWCETATMSGLQQQTRLNGDEPRLAAIHEVLVLKSARCFCRQLPRTRSVYNSKIPPRTRAQLTERLGRASTNHSRLRGALTNNSSAKLPARPRSSLVAKRARAIRGWAVAIATNGHVQTEWKGGLWS